VISLRVDPDGVIARHGLGATAGGSPDRLVEAVDAAWKARADPPLAAARAYVSRFHAPDVVGPQWVELVEKLLGSRR
jgi:hypothetical protein